MNQPANQKKGLSTSLVVATISAVILIISCIALGYIVNLGKTVCVVSGKVVGSYTKKEFASKKQTYDQEYDVVKYAVDGKEYTKSMSAGAHAGSQYATVYYFSQYPQWAWFHSKGNPYTIYVGLVIFCAVMVFIISWRQYSKKPEPTVVKKGKKNA